MIIQWNGFDGKFMLFFFLFCFVRFESRLSYNSYLFEGLIVFFLFECVCEWIVCLESEIGMRTTNH